ncbi:MAG: transcriptional repressor [Balneolales bacterium]
MSQTGESEQRLLSRKIQPTAMRLRVLDCMVQQDSAVSLSDLEKLLTHSDRITLYRTMRTFEDKGLVHQINDNSGTTKFALCASDCSCSYPNDVHIHFYCSPCDTTYCMPELTVPRFDLPQNFRADSGNFVINGRCPSCSK